MKLYLQWNQQWFQIDRQTAHSLAIPLRAGKNVPNAFFLRTPEFHPVRIGRFVGSVQQGGSCNCYDVTFNPHGNGTHTECIGHITAESFFITDALRQFWFIAQLVSITPRPWKSSDQVIAPEDLPPLQPAIEALIIRTLPNPETKKTQIYSGTNPPYLLPETMEVLRSHNIWHVLVDLPSVDREEDGGQLLAHRAFWNYPHCPRYEATITEMIYVPNTIADGLYFLELHVPAFALDAAPSRPVLYPLIPIVSPPQAEGSVSEAAEE